MKLEADLKQVAGATLALKTLDKDVKKGIAKQSRAIGTDVYRGVIAKRRPTTAGFPDQDRAAIGNAAVRVTQAGGITFAAYTSGKPLSGWKPGYASWPLIPADRGYLIEKGASGSKRLPPYTQRGRIAIPAAFIAKHAVVKGWAYECYEAIRNTGIAENE